MAGTTHCPVRCRCSIAGAKSACCRKWPPVTPYAAKLSWCGIFPDDLCFHCEMVTGAFLESRKTLPTSNSPAAEPIWEPHEWFGKRPQVDLIPTADLPMKDPPPYSGTRSLGQIGPGRPLLTSSLSPDRTAVRLDFAGGSGEGKTGILMPPKPLTCTQRSTSDESQPRPDTLAVSLILAAFLVAHDGLRRRAHQHCQAQPRRPDQNVRRRLSRSRKPGQENRLRPGEKHLGQAQLRPRRSHQERHQRQGLPSHSMTLMLRTSSCKRKSSVSPKPA